jgi:hypothetical protein
MPDPISATGAVRNPTRYGALTENARDFTGLWTQRSPYRDAAVPYLVSKFYSGSRFDSMIDGINREISQDLTDRRRFGFSVYNAKIFPAMNSFADWKFIQNGAEQVHVLGDGVDGTLYDVTAGQKTALYTKSAPAGAARVLGVNTELFVGDGVDQKKVLRSGQTWSAAKTYTVGDFILDANGNIQSFQSQAASLNVIAMQLMSITVGFVTQSFLVVTLDAAAPVLRPNQPVTFAGITATNYARFNGSIIPYANIPAGWNLNLTPSQFALYANLPAEAAQTTVGTAATFLQQDANGNNLTGVSGAALPAWSAVVGGTTQDGAVGPGVTWMCFGSAAQNWGLDTPTAAPAVTNGATTHYWQSGLNLQGYPQYGYAILDANNQIQIPFGIGTTGAQEPIWSTVLGGKTSDGTVVWMNVGTAQVWYPEFQYGMPITVIVDPNGNLQVTFDYFKTVTIWTAGVANTTGAGNTTDTNQPGPVVPPNSWGYAYYLQSDAVGDDATAGTNVTVYYADSTVGRPGDPNLVAAYNAYLAGGPPVTLNFAFLGTGTTIGPENVVVTGIGLASPPGQPRSFYYFTFTAGSTALVYWRGSGNPGYTANYAGVTDVTSWNPLLGGTTTDNVYTWLNCGPASQLTAGTLQYAQCYHSIDGSVSTASPLSYVLNAMLGAAGMFSVNVNLTPSTDPQVDQIWLMRTAGGQATPVYVDEIPNVGPSATFTYLDVIPDTSTNGQQALIPQIPAPLADSNNPPLKGMLPACYAYDRVWTFLDNMIYYSGGPDTVTGNGNTAFPPLNFIPFLGKPYCAKPVTVQDGGILVFTSSGMQIILQNPNTGKFYATNYYCAVSIANYNAVGQFNSTMFVMESNGKVSSIAVEYPFNPATGYNEVGLPIGDQFLNVTTAGYNEALFDPATVFVSWNNETTAENALYVATGNGEWFRLCAISAPETGFCWSPLGTMAAGASAMQSVETTPGKYKLLAAPGVGTTGPILFRDAATNADWDAAAGGGAGAYVPFPAYDTKGVNLLCSTGQWSEVAHVSAKSQAYGARPVVSVLLNEIEAVPMQGRPYAVLQVTGPDPARGRICKSVFSDRYDLAQNGVDTLGDSILVRFDYGVQNEADELLDWGILASVHDERKEEAQK